MPDKDDDDRADKTGPAMAAPWRDAMLSWLEQSLLPAIQSCGFDPRATSTPQDIRELSHAAGRFWNGFEEPQLRRAAIEAWRAMIEQLDYPVPDSQVEMMAEQKLADAMLCRMINLCRAPGQRLPQWLLGARAALLVSKPIPRPNCYIGLIAPPSGWVIYAPGDVSTGGLEPAPPWGEQAAEKRRGSAAAFIASNLLASTREGEVAKPPIERWLAKRSADGGWWAHAQLFRDLIHAHVTQTEDPA